MAPEGYEYTQLPPLMNATRVVNLLPGTHLEPIQCEVNVIRLDEPPPCCALSYAWGERSEDYGVFIDQKHLCITPILYNTLQHLRSQEETRTFWIDAICINQLNNTEKSSQVQKMQEIYRRSTDILVWLGPERDGSASAMALASKIAAYWSDQGLDLSDAESDFHSKSAIDLSTLLDSAPVEAFERLINRDWFERVWTVQEAAAPVKTKTVQCGDSKIGWWGFIAAAKFLVHAINRPDLKMYLPKASPLRSNSMRGLFSLDHLQRFIESGRYYTDLLEILANYRYYKATDPKDKVYALLGLVTETLTDISTCDYFLDTPTVYLKVVEHCILHRGSLECLGYCNPSLRDSDLPSWVPDWRYPGVRHPLAKWSKHKPDFGDPDLVQKRIYSSSADVTSQKRHLSFSNLQNPKLVNEGFCIGKVMTASLPFYQVATHGFESDILRGWEPENLQLMYGPTGETNLEAFSHTIVADVAKKGPLRERGYAVDWNFWRSVKDFTYPPTPSHLRVEWGSLLFATVGRSFALSNNGHMCLAPGETRPGDHICVLFGGHVFYILRPAAGGCWSFIGECYVHGLMDGEAMSLLANGAFELQDFIIA